MPDWVTADMLWRRLFMVIYLPALLLGTASCGSGEVEQTQYSTNSLLVELPIAGPEGVEGIRIFPEYGQSSSWSVYRVWPRGEIVVFHSAPGLTTIKVLDSGFFRLLPRKLVEVNSELFLIAYNPAKFSAGSTRPVELWKFDSIMKSARRLADNLKVGGIEDHLHLNVGADRLDACDPHACVSIATDERQFEWPLADALSGASIVEAVFADDGVFALVRNDIDAIRQGRPAYSIHFVPEPLSDAPFRTVANASDCIPFRLAIEGTAVTWSCARSKRDLAEVLQFDIRRLPNGGLNDLGLPNDDGRIVWSQVYTTGALVAISQRYTPQLWEALDWSNLKVLAAQAVTLIAQQGEMGLQGYYATRYSVDAEPQLFALHLGLIAMLLDNARGDGIDSSRLRDVSAAIHAELVSLQRTVEVASQFGGFKTLSFRRGAPIWADGINVPYNFLSGYAIGLLSSEYRTATDVSRSAEVLAPLATLESITSDPNWHYWWGFGASGWSADMAISTRTLEFNGDTSVAAISYRSIDASALLRLASYDASTVSPNIVKALRTYVATGKLNPAVNRELIRNGSAVVLNDLVALSHARSTAPWEIDNQVFALESLMGSWAH